VRDYYASLAGPGHAVAGVKRRIDGLEADRSDGDSGGGGGELC